MMKTLLEPFLQNILSKLNAKSVSNIQKIQSLWSDYGGIFRLTLQSGAFSSVIVKCISLQEQERHPRGWNGNISHERKLKSYLIENFWYENYAGSLPEKIKTPKLLYCEQREKAQVLVMEDLSLFYPELKSSCTFQEAKTVIKWLAGFHAHFLNSETEGLWSLGSYWHLDTRPEEWKSMKEGMLKDKAEYLDKALNEANFQTIIHGDAKVANFCFGSAGQVAGLDFQYTGKGIGMKDLAYFLGSCFSGEECVLYENLLLDYYFEQLSSVNTRLNQEEIQELEIEWRALYPVAWADFNRFLLGWLPEHQKLHDHALSKNERAFNYLESL